MNVINLLAGPVIGGVIGYCTNYIAVKMLFRPLRPIHIGKHTVPFTPGIIPKRKPALARAVGQAVGNTLFSEDEILTILTSEQMEMTIITNITGAIKEHVLSATVKELGTNLLDETSYEEKRQQLGHYVASKVTDGILSMDIGGIIASEASSAIKSKGGMLAMFVNDDLIASIATPIGNKVNEYMEEYGSDKIYSYLIDEISMVEEKQVHSLLSEIDEQDIRNFVSKVYQSMIKDQLKLVASMFDVKSIVEAKINDMDVAELETLILSVMKHELSTIVNLGAIIGFIIGLLNLFV